MTRLVHYNLDRTDEQLNTNAPFEYECSCRFGRINLQRSAFISIKLYIDEGMVLPARLSRVYIPDPESVSVEFCDAENTLIGTWNTPLEIRAGCSYVSGFVYDDMGILRGHVVCDPATPGTLSAACKFIGGDIKTSVSDFILLRQCCVPWYVGKLKRIVLNGVATSNDVLLSVARPEAGYSGGDIDDVFVWSVPEIQDGNACIQINAFGNFDDTFIGMLTGHKTDTDGIERFTVGKPGITKFSLVEGGGRIDIQDVGSSVFMIRNTKSSNLRVVTNSNKITCLSVAAAVPEELNAGGVSGVPNTAQNQPILQHTTAAGNTDTQPDSNQVSIPSVSIDVPSARPVKMFKFYDTAVPASYE